ncbi:stage III sporulation protein SpoIIIAB [Sutcliffiella rhizosphaerae]|uniref:Stage III sporulation protein AB n=1 Tax=Sutcliffiella rhizosphaerae TaxID=2880967 RepID=A0ABM8YT22_9BACI|nr:stage III sporulation protein SpoIIIAB [Sutcliffiella rhizosphaerae]CAG9623167.1 Stage III sporulation protein AB [Sutcliffiella rhizosphaerae]
MIKLLGAVFIIIATSWGGFEAARHLTERPKQLRQLKVSLQSLEAEIMYGHTPLADAAKNISNQLNKPLSTFFETFSYKLEKSSLTVRTAWNESLDEIWGSTAYKKAEIEIMKQFGETLGQHDRLTQQKHIQLALTHLEREELDARDKQTRYEQMVKSLGVLSGLLIVIILM